MLDENVKNLYAERKRWCAYNEASQDFSEEIFTEITLIYICENAIQTKT